VSRFSAVARHLITRLHGCDLGGIHRLAAGPTAAGGA